MRILLVFVFCISAYRSMKGQDTSSSSIIKDTEYYSLQKVADALYDDGEYGEALQYYNRLHFLKPDEILMQYKLGVCMAMSGEHKKSAIDHLKKAAGSGSNTAHYFIGKAFHAIAKFDSATYYYQIFKNTADAIELRKYDVERAMGQATIAKAMMASPVNVKIKNMSEKVNSPYGDYAPLVNAAGDLLYFTTRRNPNPDDTLPMNEDIWYTEHDGSSWREAIEIGAPINSKEHDATVCLSADGQLMIIYRTDPYSGEGDFFFSRKNIRQWTVPVKLGMNINSPAKELSACLSPDQQTLFFTSNRSGGYGGMDIYKAERLKNGVWGKPQNLGNHINTVDDEESPFMHADGKTLYFSSKGQSRNMGGYDIFKSVLSPSWEWGVPSNLGHPINTPEDDLYYVCTADGKKGYLSKSGPSSVGGQDVYEIVYSKDTSGLTLFTGGVLSEKDNKPLRASIRVIDWDAQTELANYTCGADGTFTIVVSSFKNYHFVFEFGNNSMTEAISPSGEYKFRKLERNIKL